MTGFLDISFVTVQVLSALRLAAFLFLISSGLTLIFGVLNILNFAHGALYMLGAYFMFWVTSQVTGPGGFFLAMAMAPLGVAVIGMILVRVMLGRMYLQEEMYQLLASYALLLAAFLFLISSGLTLIFGVLNILNFAHGALYMLGAYFMFWVTSQVTGPGGFILAMAMAPLGVALIGMILEMGLLRRIYIQEEIYQLLLTYALVLIIDDLAKIVFGAEYKSIPKPAFLEGAITLFGGTVPTYTILVVVIAPIVAAFLWYMLYRTKTGKVIRATSSDREMADALGINMKALFTLVFAFGAVLAGFGGALAGPARTVFPGVGTEIIIECFVVVVIGGLGNPWGALGGWRVLGGRGRGGGLLFPRVRVGLV